MDEVRFYFSFRSPYSWLAYVLAPAALADLPITLAPVPVFPPPGFKNDPTAVPAKLAYMLEQDLPRLARKYELPFKVPPSTDIEWMPPHAMWIYAGDEGKADAFGMGMYMARFGEGLDLGDPAVVAAVATAAGLDADATLAAGADPDLHRRVLEGMIAGVGQGLFGVPFFAYREERFFGHDRLDTLVETIRRDHPAR